MKGSELGDFWKYRVGDYRVIAHIEDDRIRIVVLRIGNRRESIAEFLESPSPEFAPGRCPSAIVLMRATN
ncbi:MAG: type II toxin-antitoxin system RelE/ParE family toxin [Shinella sp.]|nr:type II toxin-antitoxin system RelE/ParE family toxin [Shinella sp.]